CALFGIAAATEMQSHGNVAPAVPAASLIANIVIYALVAFYFFAVGIGSIRKRRWARALSLVVSAMWLAIGIVATAAIAIMLPHFLALFPPSQTSIIIVMMFAFLGVIYILIPLALVLFYRSPHVKATCEARDAIPRWTDRVPLPVLALVLLMASGALSILACIAYGVAPIFGIVLTGAPAIIVLVAIGGLCAYVALRLYLLRPSAWWTLVLLDVIGAANAAVTFTKIDLEKLYEQMGIMTPQVRAMHLADIYRDPMLWILMAICWLALFAYVIWTGRFFNAPPPRTRAGDVVAI